MEKRSLQNNTQKESYFDKELYNKWRYYVNVSALHKMESGVNNLVEFSELRKVTTVFIRLSQVKFESKEDLQIAQEALNAVQRILAVQEGTLRQFLYDDKGAVILLYFGIPPYSHNNDALNGIESSLQICSNLKRILEDFTIGVGTGMTWVGGIVSISFLLNIYYYYYYYYYIFKSILLINIYCIKFEIGK